MKNDIFRKVSLDRLSSPEELDQLITVTKPKSWIALFGLACILVVGIVWSFVGSIPIQVIGTGMITASGGVANVIHPISGRITDIKVKTGDYVMKGDVIARMEQNELVDEINKLKKFIEEVKVINKDVLDLRMMELYPSLSGLYNIATQIKQAKGKSNIDYLTQQFELLKANIVSQQTDKLDKAVETLKTNASIVSQVEGRIQEVHAEKGNIIQAGQSVASIIREDKTINSLEVVLYVSPEEGKKIIAGMEAQVSPTIVKKEDYGYMLGTVIAVSEYPITFQSLVKTLGNQELASRFSGGSAPIEVRINLTSDPSTFSGFKWSTAKGPDIKIDSGNICIGSIVTKKRRPIEMVIPSLTKELSRN